MSTLIAKHRLRHQATHVGVPLSSTKLDSGRFSVWLMMAGVVWLAFTTWSLAAEQRPNILLIMVDDMGFSDISPYGGEISTPHLQGLAEAGVRYSQYYNTSRCSPTRASLLTGQYSHNVGMGQLPSTNYNSSTRGNGTMPGYSGWFAGSDPLAPDDVPTLPAMLQSAGYATSMSGKWHLTRTNTISNGPNGTWPTDLGFDRFYGTMEGAKDYFKPVDIVDTDTPQVFEDNTALPADYFYTNEISERGAGFIRDAVTNPNGQPFFHYHAFYAPHFPLQAPRDAVDAEGNNLVEKYQALYAQGWDQIRDTRFAQQIAMEMWPDGTVLPDAKLSDSRIPAWNSLTSAQQEELTLRMAIYAAQVEIMDQGVGRLLDAVDDPNGDGDTSDSVRDNTTILFVSDNGAVNGNWSGNGDVSNWDSSASPTGVKYGSSWATLSNTPFRKFKSDNYEGGISSPLIIAGNGVDPSLAGTFNKKSVAHVIDIVPTLLDLSGATYPAAADATELEGESLVRSFRGAHQNTERELYFEHEGNRAVRVGEWKVVARNGTSDYELYNLANDRGELNNLALQRPDLLRTLRQKWEAWAERNQVATQSQDNAGSPFLSHDEIDWIGPRQAAGDLMLHFDFDAPTYNNFPDYVIQDQSGSGFRGIIWANNSGNMAYASGVAGIDGMINLFLDRIWVEMPTDIPLGNESRSIALWFNSDQIGSDKHILAYGTEQVLGSKMLLTMEGEDPNNAVMKVDLNGAVLQFDPGINNPISEQTWVHAVLVVPEGATTSADLKMFINGVEVVGELVAGEGHVPLATGSSDLAIGHSTGSLSEPLVNSFDGKIGDLQIYGRGISPDEAAYLFTHPGETLLEIDGDYNGDGIVDIEDYNEWKRNYGSRLHRRIDGNGDGVVDAADYSLWRDNLGASSIPTASVESLAQAVPVPATGGLLLVVLGLGTLCHHYGKAMGLSR